MVHASIKYRQTDKVVYSTSDYVFETLNANVNLNCNSQSTSSVYFHASRSARQNSERSLHFSCQNTKRGTSFLLHFSRCLILVGKHNSQSELGLPSCGFWQTCENFLSRAVRSVHWNHIFKFIQSKQVTRKTWTFVNTRTSGPAQDDPAGGYRKQPPGAGPSYNAHPVATYVLSGFDFNRWSREEKQVVTRDANCGAGLQFIRWRSVCLKPGWFTRIEACGTTLRVWVPALELQAQFNPFFAQNPLSESIMVSSCLSDSFVRFISNYECNKPTFYKISHEVSFQNCHMNLSPFHTCTTLFIPILHSISTSL